MTNKHTELQRIMAEASHMVERGGLTLAELLMLLQDAYKAGIVYGGKRAVEVAREVLGGIDND